MRTSTGAIRTIPRPPRGPASAPTGTTGPSARTASLRAERDHVAGAGSDPDLWIEATAWASVVGSGRPRPSRPPMSGRTTGPCRCPSSGRHRRPSRSPSARQSERITGMPPRAAPRSRRARRAAEERAAGSPGRHAQRVPRAVAPTPAGRAPRRSGPSPAWRPSGCRPVGNRTGARTPRTGPGTAATARAEPGDDRIDSVGRRHASAHGRHSEERDDVAGRADRPRHRRPEH